MSLKVKFVDDLNKIRINYLIFKNVFCGLYDFFLGINLLNLRNSLYLHIV
jgi:hypothetical protein